MVDKLGMKQGAKSAAAAAIVDKVMKITPQQLAAMDAVTRDQVLKVRADLGVDPQHKNKKAGVRGKQRL